MAKFLSVFVAFYDFLNFHFCIHAFIFRFLNLYGYSAGNKYLMSLEKKIFIELSEISVNSRVI